MNAQGCSAMHPTSPLYGLSMELGIQGVDFLPVQWIQLGDLRHYITEIWL